MIKNSIRKIINLRIHPLSIVVPIYDDWESLRECLLALHKFAVCDEIILVNDCGPNVDDIEKRVKLMINSDKRFKYFRNTKNLGFIKTCNKAVYELADPRNDILLLNSDAVITRGAIKSMNRVLYAKRNIAAVCPRSNAATIFSVPMPTPSNNKEYSMEESFEIYSFIKPKLPDYYLSPLAHGFCIMIKRQIIAKFGLFDVVYGKGYGEENDFCMRVHRQGKTCAVANKAFVFHYKNRSFGAIARNRLVAKNEKILKKRYPEFDRLVGEYCSSIDEDQHLKPVANPRP